MFNIFVAHERRPSVFALAPECGEFWERAGVAVEGVVEGVVEVVAAEGVAVEGVAAEGVAAEGVVAEWVPERPKKFHSLMGKT